MAFVVMVLAFVLIVRFSITAGYRPGLMMAPFGVVSGLSSIGSADLSWVGTMLFGVFSAILLWIWLKLMAKAEGAFFLWWPLFVSGLFISIWVTILVGLVMP